MAQTVDRPAATLKSHVQPNAEWLAQRQEAVIDPELPIVDAHHHIWAFENWSYMLPELAADIASGHNVRATVAVDSHAMYRADGPEEFRPVGETEFVNGIAAMSASGQYGPARICAGIVGHVDLRIGARARDVLEAHVGAGGGRFRGTRQVAVWHADPAVITIPPEYQVGPQLLAQQRFREGFACLAPLGLSFDTMVLHTQLTDVADLAKAFPATRIIINHVGVPCGLGPYLGRRDEVFVEWRHAMQTVAHCPNVSVKLGGLGLRWTGFNFNTRPVPPSSEELAEAWQPYVEAAITAFGPERCMFDSNFPPDKMSCSYAVLWNAFKRMTSSYSAGEKGRMFSGTAAEVYRIAQD